MFEAIEQKTDALRRCGRDRKEALTNLKRTLDAEWTFQEMAVSGTPLARMDVRRMVEIRKEPLARARVLREAYNFYKATQFIDRYVPRAPRELAEADILGAHAVLTRGVCDEEAATYRKTALRDPEVGHAAEVSEIASAMTETYAWLKSSSHQHPIRQATELQLRLHFVQPFQQMNGRLARLLSNLVLMQRGLPPALLNGDDRGTYHEAIARAPKDGGWALAQLLAAATERSLDFCLETVERVPVLAVSRG